MKPSTRPDLSHRYKRKKYSFLRLSQRRGLVHFRTELFDDGHEQSPGIHTKLVYTILVKNITLSADEHLIELARNKAREQHTTLNAAFREWLVLYTGQQDRVKRYKDLMQQLRYVRAGRRFTRDEMNER